MLKFNRQDRSSPRAYNYKAAKCEPNAWFYSTKTTAYEDSSLEEIGKTASKYVHYKCLLTVRRNGSQVVIIMNEDPAPHNMIILIFKSEHHGDHSNKQLRHT